jgi:hypothetical protein
MMREPHVISRIRPDGSVLMQHVISYPPLDKEAHRLTFKVSESLVVIIWWPECLPPEKEIAETEVCIQNLKDSLQFKRVRGDRN